MGRRKQRGEYTMAMFTFSVFIDRPQQEVFDLLVAPVNIHQEMPLMGSAAWASNVEPGVPSTGRGIMQMVRQETEIIPQITEWDPPCRYGIKIRNEQFPFEVMQYVYILALEDGGTRVTVDCESEWVHSP
jgi:hypothetical protein